MTSKQRRNDADATSLRRRIDVKTMSCVYLLNPREQGMLTHRLPNVGGTAWTLYERWVNTAERYMPAKIVF